MRGASRSKFGNKVRWRTAQLRRKLHALIKDGRSAASLKEQNEW